MDWGQKSEPRHCDARGRFEATRGATYIIRAEGFTTFCLTISDADPVSEMIVKLEPSASIDGTVKDSWGRPVAGLVLWISSGYDSYAPNRGDVGRSAGTHAIPPCDAGRVTCIVTDAAGSFRIAGVRPGRVFVDLEEESEYEEVASAQSGILVHPGQNSISIRVAELYMCIVVDNSTYFAATSPIARLASRDTANGFSAEDRFVPVGPMGAGQLSSSLSGYRYRSPNRTGTC
jgi:hypothetical protein